MTRVAALIALTACSAGADDDEADDRLSCAEYAALICSRACECPGGLVPCSFGVDDGAHGFASDQDCTALLTEPWFCDLISETPASCDETIERAGCETVDDASWLMVGDQCDPHCYDEATAIGC